MRGLHQMRKLFVVAAVLGAAGQVAVAQCMARWLSGPGQGLVGADGGVSDAITWDPDGAGPEASVSGFTMSVGTTSAPRDARARAMDRPMPRPAPVTTATFPVKSNMAH